MARVEDAPDARNSRPRASPPYCVPTPYTCGLLLIYPTLAVSFCVWIMIGYFASNPRELDEAALIDGGSDQAGRGRSGEWPGHR